MSSPVHHLDKHGEVWKHETWRQPGDALRRVEAPPIAFRLAEADARYGPFTPPLTADACPACREAVTGE